MSSFKLEKFGGMMPAWNDQYIPEGQASYARNCYLFSGALAGWRKPKLLRALTNSAAKFVYRIPAFSQTYADANLIFVAQVSQGDTIKIGEETYTFTATVTLAYDVLIGASAHDTAGNLYLALTLGGTAGVQYGVGCQTNPMIDVDHVQFGTFDFGTGDLPWVYVRARHREGVQYHGRHREHFWDAPEVVIVPAFVIVGHDHDVLGRAEHDVRPDARGVRQLAGVRGPGHDGDPFTCS